MDPTISQIQIGDTTYNLVDKYDRSQYTTFSNNILKQMSDSNGFNTKIIQKDEKKDELIYITKASDEKKLSQMTIKSNDIELKRAKNDKFNTEEQVLFKVHISDDNEIDTITKDYPMNHNLNYADTSDNQFFLESDHPIYRGETQDATVEFIKQEYIKITLIKDGESGFFESNTRLFDPNDWIFISNSGYGSIAFKEPTDNSDIRILDGDIVRIEYRYQRKISDTEQYYTLGYRSEQDSIGNFSVAEGYNNIASGNYSHAEGNSNQAIGESSHAEGVQTIAAGQYSHTEGVSSQTAPGAQGDGAHAEGKSTRAIAQAAHAEGYNTIAGGDASHAGGTNTQALENNSFSHGTGTVARELNQFVIGKYNTDSDDALFIVGNGEGNSADQRSNAFEITRSGMTRVNNLNIQSSNIELKKQPDVTATGNHLYFTDKNQSIASLIYPQITRDGTTQLILQTRMPNKDNPSNNANDWNSNYFIVGTKMDGSPFFSIPDNSQEVFRRAIGIKFSSTELDQLETLSTTSLDKIINNAITVDLDDAEGVLPIPKGGTGASNANEARKKLGASTSSGKGADGNTYNNLWPVTLGGTGAANKDDARKNLGAKEIKVSNKKYKVWTIEQGGTGAADQGTARKNLGATVTNKKGANGNTYNYIWPVTLGGTGAANQDDARKNLGASKSNKVGTTTYTGVWPIELGGTGASSKTSALTSLGAQPLLKPVTYSALSYSNNSSSSSTVIMNKLKTSSSDKISFSSAHVACYGKVRCLTLTLQIRRVSSLAEYVNARDHFNESKESVKKDYVPFNINSIYKGFVSNTSDFFPYTCILHSDTGEIEFSISFLPTAINYVKSIPSGIGILLPCCFTYFVK